MGICPSLDPQTRVLQTHNQFLKQLLLSQLKDLRIYNFHTPLLQAIQTIPTRYLYNEGILEDIDKLGFYAERRGVSSMESHVSLFGEFQEQVRDSCLILENQVVSEVESKEFQRRREDSDDEDEAKEKNDKEDDEQQQRPNEDHANNPIPTNFSGTHSFRNNLSRNQSLVAQMNLIYGREINREEYSQSLKLFLKWVQYFNEHSYGGFLKTIYKAFCQSLYRLDRKEFDQLVDQVAIFVQYMVKVYTKIYHLQQLNRTVDGKLFKNENVYNLIMSFMFRKTKIKPFVKVTIRENNASKIRKFEEKMKILSKKGVGHFGIDGKFVLIRNEEWERMLKRNSENTTWSNKNVDTRGLMGNTQGDVHSQPQPSQEQQRLLLESFKSHLQSSCYQKSLHLLAQLSSTNDAITPISKLKTIITIAKTIQQQISFFYLHQLHLSKAQIPDLDPDNLTAIIIYLICMNNNANLYEELKMVEYFTTTNTLNCISGYYLNVFVAAIQSILEWKV